MSDTTPTIRELMARVEDARSSLHDAARPDAVAKVRARGRLSARERIARLIDEGSFDEIGGLVVASDLTDPVESQKARERTPADGVIAGTARIDGRPVAIFSQDFSVQGGSIGRLGSAKGRRVLQIALTEGVPMVMILDGGGHRIQDGQDSRHFAAANGMFHDMARASGWIPMVALMLGAGFAGPTNYAGMADCVVMVRGLSTMGLAGPALVKAAIGEDCTDDELGGAETHAQVTGLGEYLTEDDAHAIALTRELMDKINWDTAPHAPALGAGFAAPLFDEQELMGIVPTKSGTVSIEDKNITGMKSHQRVANGIAYVPQGRMIFSTMTVQENVEVGLTVTGESKVPGDIYELFPVLLEMKKRRGGNLSGGQQQQLAIARALASKPKVLLLDEPTEGIQPSIIREMGRTLKRIRDERGLSIVVSEQVLSFALDIADRVLVMENGEIVHENLRSEVDEAKVASFLSV